MHHSHATAFIVFSKRNIGRLICDNMNFVLYNYYTQVGSFMYLAARVQIAQFYCKFVHITDRIKF